MAASASGIRKRNFAEFSKGLDSKNRLADKVVFPKYETQLLYPRSGGKGGGAAARLDQLVTKLIDARSFDCCVGAHCLDAAASDVHPRDYKFCSECGKGVCPLCFDDLRDARCPHCREDDPWQVKTEKHELTKLAMEVISANAPAAARFAPVKRCLTSTSARATISLCPATCATRTFAPSALKSTSLRSTLTPACWCART